MYASTFEEHLAHSAPCNSRFDGFCRGDTIHMTEGEVLAELAELAGEIDEYRASGANIGPQLPAADLWEDIPF